MNQLIVILFIIIGLIILISGGLSSYITLSINKKIKNISNEIHKIKTEKSNNHVFDLNLSMDLKKCIDELIEDEIINVLKTYIVTNEKYDMLKIDIDAKNIANNVYKAFKKDYLTYDNLIFETEFYQSYMIKRTITRLLLLVKDYNIQ